MSIIKKIKGKKVKPHTAVTYDYCPHGAVRKVTTMSTPAVGVNGIRGETTIGEVFGCRWCPRKETDRREYRDSGRGAGRERQVNTGEVDLQAVQSQGGSAFGERPRQDLPDNARRHLEGIARRVFGDSTP